MIEPYSAICPNCGSLDTLRSKGPQGLCPGCTQQRHECRTCGQKFLSFWDMTGVRAYGEPGQAEGACHA
jgi:hypothetical protein